MKKNKFFNFTKKILRFVSLKIKFWSNQKMIYHLIIFNLIQVNTFINYQYLQSKIKNFHIYYDFYTFILIRNYKKKLAVVYTKLNFKIIIIYDIILEDELFI